MIGIYKITNKITNYSYIGQSKNIKRRFIEHRTITHEHNKLLKEDFIKYGLDSFEFDVLEECQENELHDKEVYWVDKIQPQYNKTAGGTGAKGHKVSKETRIILSQKGKEFWNNLSKEKQQEIIRNNLTGWGVGHQVSAETREKLRKANLGKKRDKSSVNKFKETMKLKYKNGYVKDNSKCRKMVICLETNKIYESVKEAALDNNIGPTNVSGVVTGRYKTTHGLHFQYYPNK